jgi:hypothetical protein
MENFCNAPDGSTRLSPNPDRNTGYRFEAPIKCFELFLLLTMAIVPDESGQNPADACR